jgi:hypothetical protein
MLSSTDQVTSQVRQAGGGAQHKEKARIRHGRQIHRSSAVAPDPHAVLHGRRIHPPSAATPDPHAVLHDRRRTCPVYAAPTPFLLPRQPQPPLSRFSWAKTYPIMGYCGQYVSAPVSNFFSFSFSDTQWIRIHRVSDTYPYPIRIRRVSTILVPYRCFVGCNYEQANKTKPAARLYRLEAACADQLHRSPAHLDHADGPVSVRS